MLDALVPEIWTEQAPQTFLGLDLGTRMTVVRLRSGGLLLYASISATPERQAEVMALGPVEVVVCPNCFHHLYAGEWTAAAPRAEVWAPPGLAKKRPDLRIDRVLQKDEPSWRDECEPIPVLGVSQLQESVLWHVASRTLIAADLFQNYAGAPGGPWTKIYFRLAGLTHGPVVSRMIRLAYRDRRAARRSIDRLIALEPERIVVCHGELVMHDGAQALRDAFAWLRDA